MAEKTPPKDDRVITPGRRARERSTLEKVESPKLTAAIENELDVKAHVFFNRKGGPLTITDAYKVDDPYDGIYETDYQAAKSDEAKKEVLKALADAHYIEHWLGVRKLERTRIVELREGAERRLVKAEKTGSKKSKALRVMKAEVVDLQKREDWLLSSTITGDGSLLKQGAEGVIISHALEVEDDRAGVVETVSRNLVIEPPFHPGVLEQLALNNSSLLQLINAMEVNIDGTGWELIPRDTFKMEEEIKEDTGLDTEQAETAKGLFQVESERQEKEFQEEIDQQMEGLEGFFNEPWPGRSWTTVRRKLRVDMETTGNAYLEVMRNATGEIVFARHVDTKLMRLVRLDDPIVVNKEIERGGLKVTVPVSLRERRYVEQVGGGALVPRFTTQQFGTADPNSSGTTLDSRRLFTSQGTRIVYFREFGSSRDLDMWTGIWAGPAVEIPMERRATEMMHFTVKKSPRTPYGLPRWINNLPSVLGSRKAEEFNLAFFRSGGVPPLLITIAGGQMSERTREALDQKMNNSNPASKHQAVILEITGTGMMDKQNKVQVNVERFGSEKMQDALFLKYGASTANNIRESFRLPPLFIGDPDAHNFATAKASYLVAEAQVFQPERDEFDEIVTMMLLRNMPNGDRFRFRSLPLVIDDADSQIKCIEIVADNSLVDGAQLVDALNKVCNLDFRFDQDTSDASREERMARVKGMAEAFAASSQEAGGPDDKDESQAAAAAGGDPAQQIQDDESAKSVTKSDLITDVSDMIGKRLDGLVVLGVDFADSLAKGKNSPELRKNLALMEGMDDREMDIIRRVATMRAKVGVISGRSATSRPPLSWKL